MRFALAWIRGSFWKRCRHGELQAFPLRRGASDLYLAATMTKSIFRTALCALFGAASALTAQDAKTYTITLDRPVKAGDKFHDKITFESVNSQVVSVGGKPVQENEEKAGAELEGTMEVLQATEQGNASKLKYTIKKLVIRSGAEKEEPLQAGDELICEMKNGKESFTVKGEEADEATTKILGSMIHLVEAKSKMDVRNEDKAFNTDKPHAVGSEWDINPKEFIASMPEEVPFEMAPDATSGKMKFNAIKEVDGVKCGHMSAQVTMTPKGMKGLPPQFKLKRSAINVALDGHFPMDSAMQPLKSTMKMQFEFSGDVDSPEGAAQLKVRAEMNQTEERRPVKE
jgi:hypothetical protein